MRTGSAYQSPTVAAAAPPLLQRALALPPSVRSHDVGDNRYGASGQGRGDRARRPGLHAELTGNDRDHRALFLLSLFFYTVLCSHSRAVYQCLRGFYARVALKQQQCDAEN